MSPTQKVIKYVAMAFAVGLMVTILSSILLVVTGISQSNHLFASETDYIDFTKEFPEVQNLDISNYSGKIYVQAGNVDQIIVEAKNVPENLTAKITKDDTLLIEDPNHDNFLFSIWFLNTHNDEDSKITIIIPMEIYFETVKVDNGSESMELSGFQSKIFYLDGGSGSVIVSDVSSEEADISAGSGALTMDNVSIKTGDFKSRSGAVRITNSRFINTEFETGSGAFSFSGELTGENIINSNSGAIFLELKDRIDKYNLDLDAGSGGVWVNGVKYDKEDIKNTAAENYLSVEGGSGKVTVNFMQ